METNNETNGLDVPQMSISELTIDNFAAILPELYAELAEKIRDEFRHRKGSHDDDNTEKMSEQGIGSKLKNIESMERKNAALREELWLAQNRNATDNQLKEHFEKMPELRDQFSDFISYIAYVRHLPKR